MSKTSKKRVKLGEDGWYYPQSRCCFIWLNYEADYLWATSTQTVKYASVESAINFLHLQDDKELEAIEKAKKSKVIEFVRT